MRLFRSTAILLTLVAPVSGCGRDSGAAEPAKSAPTAPVPSATAATPSPEATATPQTPFDPDAAYDTASALAAARKFAEARQAFEEGSRQAPKHGALAAGVAIFADLRANRISEDVVQRLFQAGQHATADNWVAAQADIDAAIRLAPRYPRAHGLRGTLFLEQGRPADALDAFDAAVRIDPEFAEGYYNRGAAHAALDHFDAAIADFSRAIELRADFWDAYANRGFTLVRRGAERQSEADATAAMEDYNRAHQLNPAAVEPIYLRGVLFALAEQWADAERDFTAAIALDPTNPKPLIDRALVYDKQSRHDLAAADRDKATALQK